jgi:signal transduction histidine kinase
MGAFHFTAGRTEGPRLSPAALLTTMLAVFAGAAGVVAITHYAHSVIGIWVSNAILLAALMQHDRRDWGWIAGTGLIANIAGDMLAYPFEPALAFAILNFLEVGVVALPLRSLRLDHDFTRPLVLLAFYALAVIAPIVSAIPCALYFHVFHDAPFFSTAFDWFSADALGLVIVVPPLLTVKWNAVKIMFRNDQIVWTTTLMGILLAAILFNYFARTYPFAFLFFPIVVLMTFQRGFAGGTLGLFMVAAYMIVPAIYGQSSGVLHTHPIHDQVTVVQLFIAVIGFSNILVGAALEERRRLEQGLANAIARAENSREEAIVAKEAAEKANRTKSMFLANMSHELRTPLNAVIGFAEMMHGELFGPLGDPHYREYTSVIQGAGRHLLELINDILDMSKIEAGKHEIKREHLDIGDIIRDSLGLMAENASSGGVTLVSDLPSSPLAIDADRRAMKQILLNLLSNAIKFTPSGGKVTAKAGLVDGRVVLSVRDTGIGIPKDQIYRLGNPFVQIRNHAGVSQNGTGLGLALVRSLAEMQDGELKIESEEGRGTLVSVSFPAAAAATASLAA